MTEVTTILHWIISKHTKVSEKLIWDYDENAVNFKWSNIQRENEKEIDYTHLIQSKQKQADKKIFQKITWRLFYYYNIVHKVKKIIKKIYFKVISIA